MVARCPYAWAYLSAHMMRAARVLKYFLRFVVTNIIFRLICHNNSNMSKFNPKPISVLFFSILQDISAVAHALSYSCDMQAFVTQT